MIRLGNEFAPNTAIRKWCDFVVLSPANQTEDDAGITFRTGNAIEYTMCTRIQRNTYFFDQAFFLQDGWTIQ
jgi:hypothetical protein